MAKNTLVGNVSGGRRDPLISQGASLLKLLDEHAIPITAAFWLLDADSQTWKYILASPSVNTRGPLQIYKSIQQFVGQAGLTLQDIAVVSPHEPLVELLRVAIRTPTTGIAGIRFTGNAINNVFIDDAYIYRLA
jgi:hypothetical protein